MSNKKFLGARFEPNKTKKIKDFCQEKNISIDTFLNQSVDTFFEKETSKSDYISFVADKLFILNYMQILSLSKTDKNTATFNDQAIKKLQEIKDEFSKK
jgi:hypothetical protein